jgi:hypothetical protein
MGVKSLDVRQAAPLQPFSVVKWTGQNPGSLKNPFYVSDGVILSTFSYATGKMIPIKKVGKAFACNQVFDFQPNHKVYIEFTVYPNLQLSGASIYCERVGSPDPNNVKELYPEDWPSYPDLVHIEPKDVYENGRIKILKNGKRQGKCYALLAYRSDDDEQDGQTYNQDGNSDNEGSQANNSGDNFMVVQSFNSDIIMVNVAINGTPCVVPMPYFNASNHYRAVIST